VSNTARPKFSTTAPAYFEANQTENPRKSYHSREARPPGRSGGAPPVSTPHRVSSSIRKRTKKASRRRG
jgi:hypothetical protein